jgi:hypothetical protein
MGRECSTHGEKIVFGGRAGRKEANRKNCM